MKSVRLSGLFCDELSKDVFLRDYEVSLHAEGWEDVIPSAGRPQEIINTLVEKCDIFICMFHKRFGSPSGKAKSGTLEEFLKAYNKWKDKKKPHTMLYFKDRRGHDRRDQGPSRCRQAY